MNALNLINQWFNFVAPAAGVALLLVALGRIFPGIFKSKRPLAHTWWAQSAIIFVVGVLLMLIALVVFGRDGKMASYALLAVGAATCQWMLLRSWKV